MSWWDIGDDVIGDAPADILTRELMAAVRAREEKGGAKPTAQELLEAFTAALRKVERGERYVFHKLYWRRQSQAALIATGESASDDLVSALEQSFAEIDAEYRRRFERKPRLTEILQTAIFILGHEPERFLSDAQRMKTMGIAAE
jgi:hypothetical protein